MPKEAAIGVDPWCISVDTAKKWERAFSKKQQQLVQTSVNLVDEVWTSRPPPEINPVLVHPLKFAGRSVSEKLKDLRDKLLQEKARGAVFTALDEASPSLELYACLVSLIGLPAFSCFFYIVLIPV